MKTKMALLLALPLAWAPLRAQERVDLRQLPPAVKKSLDREAGGDYVRQITLHHENGRTVYDVELERKNMPNPKISIAEDGTIVREPHFGTPMREVESSVPYSDFGTPVTRRYRVEELPENVRRTIEREANGRKIASIAEDRVDGIRAYAVEYGEKGRNPVLYVAADDGRVLRPAEKPALFGTNFGELPAAAQSTLRRELRDREITRIKREAEPDGRDTYRVEAKGHEGTFELRVSEDGRVLEDTRGRGGSEEMHKRG